MEQYHDDDDDDDGDDDDDANQIETPSLCTLTSCFRNGVIASLFLAIVNKYVTNRPIEKGKSRIENKSSKGQ